jgi:hypothetical protein
VAIDGGNKWPAWARRAKILAAMMLLPAGLASGQSGSAAGRSEIRPAVPPKEGAAISADESALEQDVQLRQLIELYDADSGSLTRTYPLRMSLTRQQRLGELYAQYLSLLEKLGGKFDGFSQAGKIDFLLLKSYLERARPGNPGQAARDCEHMPFAMASSTRSPPAWADRREIGRDAGDVEEAGRAGPQAARGSHQVELRRQ